MTDATPADDAATGTTLKEKAKAATKAAALAAEKTKISKVSLPSAYAALGKACYKKKQWEEDFPEIYQELRDLSAEQKEAKEKAAQEPEAKGFADKAKSIAKQGVQLAKKQQLNLQISLALAKLGQAAFEKHGKESGPDELVAATESLTARLAALDSEISGQVTKAGGKKKLMWVAGALCVFLFIGLMTDSSEPVNDPTASATSDPSSTDEEDPADPLTTDNETTIAADDLVEMNPAAVSKTLKGRFVVTGRVIKTEASKGFWGKPVYTLSISGDAEGILHKNSRGYIGRWVECEFNDNSGLDSIQNGQFVHIEGVYDRKLHGDVVDMNKCSLSRDYHIVE